VEAAEPSADVDTQPTSTPMPGEDVSNLLDAILVMEEHASNGVCHVRFSILACTIRRRPPGRYWCALTAATIANWNCGDLRLSGDGRCNPDLAAELVYVLAILARSSA
jgi:hypothetical protein